MSKIYFTKLLPVEGEIKDKDWYWDKLNKIYEQAYPESNFEWLNSGAFPKVKLFLCSRDIQVGDRATDPTIAPKDGLVYQGGDKWLNDMGDAVELPDWKTRFNFIKVIGEISSDAVWVKEGDEFDEDGYIPGYVEKDCLNEN